MLTLRFANDAVWRDCCDGPHMQRRWGLERARHISRRLQQLEAMTALADLDFMPFDSREHDDGLVEVAVDEAVSVFMRHDNHRPQEEGPLSATLIVSALGPPSQVVP